MSAIAEFHPSARPVLRVVPDRPVSPDSPALLRKLQAMRGLRYFDAASDVELSGLAVPSLIRQFGRGRTILPGLAGHDFVFLLEGRAKVTTPRGSACGELAFGIFDKGDLLCDGGWAGDVPLFASETIALEPSVALFIPRRTLMAFLESNARVAVRFLEATSARLRRVTNMAAQNSCLDVAERLYRKLVELSESRGVRRADGALRIEHGLHQAELAASIGASREAVNRQIAEWRESGLLESGRGFVLVRDPLGLTMSLPQGVRDTEFAAGRSSRTGDRCSP